MDFGVIIDKLGENMSIALYPGTFDPVTNGHLDVLSRASRLFDQVIVAVSGDNSEKQTAFDVETRVALVRENLASHVNATVEAFDGLLVDYAREKGASVLVRGLRAVSDFEYEFQMAQMNRHLDSELETIFLMPNEKYFYTSSQLIKQVHLYGTRETDLVPRNVLDALRGLCLKNKISE
jgi:pantetheine-phosphate adenylyltransferase